MARRMSVHEARANFSDVLGSVYHTGEPVIVERRGKPVAVLVSPEEYARLSPDSRAADPPRGNSPLPERTTEAELVRRKELLARILANREHRDVRPFTSVDLVRISREEEEASHGRGA